MSLILLEVVPGPVLRPLRGVVAVRILGLFVICLLTCHRNYAQQIRTGDNSVPSNAAVVGGVGANSVSNRNTAGREFYPQSFGAVADRETDDTAAIQAAIDKAHAMGGGVVVLSGRFKITAQLRLRSKVDLRGVVSSRLAEHGLPQTLPESEIFNAGSGGAIAINDSTGYRNEISELTLSGTSKSGNAIDIDRVYDGIIDRCVIYSHGGIGVNATHAASWTIRDCFIFNCQYGVRTGADTNGWNIVGNHIQSSRSIGLYLDSGWGTSVTGNTIEGSAFRNMYCRTAGGLVIHGNYFEGRCSSQIYFDSYCKAISVVGNMFFGPADGEGLSIVDGSYEIDDFTIQDNWFRGLGRGVVLLPDESASNLILGPNHFSDATISRYVFGGKGKFRNVRVFDDAATDWQKTKYYSVGQTCMSDDGKVYSCKVAGTTAAVAPRGVGDRIIDGEVVWQYVAAREYGDILYGNSVQVGVRGIKSRNGDAFQFSYERATRKFSNPGADDDLGGGRFGFCLFAARRNSYALLVLSEDGVASVISGSSDVSTQKGAHGTWNLYLDPNGHLHVENATKSGNDYLVWCISGDP